ncbi:MAG: 1,4-dihydroxy-2-naphthoate polyprenyltransferase [Chitinophagaceae bacterium]|nr:1,4-dihydroxy-2-naphthoate polyprenyltransferase [Chitinophagaceae bacterium]
MASVSAWIVTFRLRTLPLSLSTIILGACLAAFHHSFRWNVFTWAILTTLFLQILSNLANDYGDAVNGVDNPERTGPKRSLQAGLINLRQMRRAVAIFIILSFVSGIFLIIEGTRGLRLSYSVIFLVLGIAAIISALKYTIGKNPYGYAGLGDIFVFIFFGIIGVTGSYFLFTHKLTLPELLPAVSMGCFSTGVLNLNNLRDRQNDKAFGKHTLVVKLGVRKAKYYHAILLAAGMMAAIIYSMQSNASGWQWIYLFSFAGIIRSIIVVFRNEDPARLDPELKKLALYTLLFAVLFGVGLIAC